MKHIITDDPQANTEVMFNLAYVKDKEVWIRGGGPDGEDCTLIEFQKRLCKNRDECNYECADFDELPWDSVENIGDVLMDCSMDGCPQGTAYFIAIQAAELRERLRMHEEKQTPKDIKSYYGLAGGPHGTCPSCCTTIPRIIGQETRYCPFCGQAVKWQ